LRALAQAEMRRGPALLGVDATRLFERLQEVPTQERWPVTEQRIPLVLGDFIDRAMEPQVDHSRLLCSA
jgi:hypothetical protein